MRGLARTYIEERVCLDEATGCWEWQRSKHPQGYGCGYFRALATRQAHRIAAYAFLSMDPGSKLCVLHKCDNPSCVNPDHLFLGTQGDNIRDMGAKGRRVQGDNRGERNGQSKLKARDVVMIRHEYGTKDITRSGVTQRDLATRYGVSQQTISDVLTKNIWQVLQTEVGPDETPA